jgi:hypothetical protein
LAGCAAPTLLAGDADLKLSELVKSQAATPKDFAALLADDVEVHTKDGTQHGAAAGAELLGPLKPGGFTRVLRHHDVSLMVLGDGRVLLMQRNANDRVSKAIELRRPTPRDGTSWQGVEYGHAWNVDEADARMALLGATWTETGRYVDPGKDVIGPQGISDMIGNLRKVAVGSQVITTTGLADCGGGWFTWDWIMKTRGITFFRGFDVLHLNDAGKFDFLASFFDRRSPAGDAGRSTSPGQLWP